MAETPAKTTTTKADPKADTTRKDKLLTQCEKLLCQPTCPELSLFELECPSTKDEKYSRRTMFMILYIVLPPLMAFYALGVFFVACVNRKYSPGEDVSLFWSVFGTWLAGLVLLLFKSCIYLPCSTYCSIHHRDNHKALHWMTYLCYASILFGYEVYAFTLSGWAALGVFLFWLLYTALYVIVFVERHVRPCRAYGIENKQLDNGCHKALFVLSLVAHLGFLFCCVVFNYQLTQAWRVNRVSCTSPGTCDCLAGG